MIGPDYQSCPVCEMACMVDGKCPNKDESWHRKLTVKGRKVG